MKKRTSQSGVALITAILIVTLVTVAAVAAMSRQQIAIARTANVIEADQAYLYALGAESWAMRVLALDADDSDTDHLGEDWAAPLPPIAIEQGTVVGRIEDMQGRFNLNNLAATGVENPAEIARFRRLLEALELEPELADAVADWIDSDVQARIPDGAEDDEYLRLDPPYRAGNRPMTSTSELRLVIGVTQEIYETLAPHVSALPEATAININTASGPVLMSLAEGISKGDADVVVSDREAEAFPDVDTALAHPVFAAAELDGEGEGEDERGIEGEAGIEGESGIEGEGEFQGEGGIEGEGEFEGISVASTHFRIVSEVSLPRGRALLYSTVRRSPDGEFEVMMRNLGAP